MLADWVRRTMNRRVLVIWFSLSLILSLVGPFGTFYHSPWPARFGYWLVVIAVAVALSELLLLLFGRLMPGSGFWAREAATITLFTASYTPALYGFTLLTKPEEVLPTLGPLQLAALVALASATIAAIKYVVAPGEAPAPAGPPRLSDRLEPELRGPILHLSGRDHYVDVRTEKGQGTLLIRFGDALREVADCEGLRVHRSHWLGDRAVERLERDNGRLMVRLVTGARVPVSRTYRARVEQRWGNG